MNITSLRWWVIFCSVMFVLVYLGHLGLLAQLWLVDQSHVASVTLGLFVIVTGFIGYLTHRLTNPKLAEEDYKKLKSFIQPCWYSSELFMGMGMVGTLIGFMLMLGPAVHGINVADPDSSKQAILNMAGGMGTAVLCTLAGISCSLLIKLQMSNLGISIERDEDDDEEEKPSK